MVEEYGSQGEVSVNSDMKHLETVLNIVKLQALYAKCTSWDILVAHVAFTTLKHVVTTTPVLKLLDFSQSFVMKMDTSKVGFRAVVSQGKHPIAYFSKKLFPRIQKQSAYS